MIKLELSSLFRHLWFALKKLLKLPLSSDKNHVSLSIVRGIISGEITKESALTSTIVRDGFGSQALARLSIMAAANDLGVDYIHAPFSEVAHTEGNPKDWAERCERLLELGSGHRTIDEASLPDISMIDFVSNRHLWKKPHVIVVHHMLNYCNRNPEIYKNVINSSSLHRNASSGELSIAVHMRRGDISRNHHSHRYTGIKSIRRSLELVAQICEKIDIKYKINVYSNATDSELSELLDMGWTLHNRLGALEAFDEMRCADVLFTAKSSFSYLAALHSMGVVIYEPYREKPLSNWILRSSNGTFSEVKFIQTSQSVIKGRQWSAALKRGKFDRANPVA